MILINGPMGIGKTTAGQSLAEKLPNYQLIDGDDVWRILPFEVNEEARKLVVANLLIDFKGEKKWMKKVNKKF